MKSRARLTRIKSGLNPRLSLANNFLHGGPHLRRPQLITLIRRMKSIAREILRMRRQLRLRDRINVENRHSIALRNLSQPLTKLLNLPLVLTPQRTRNSRRTRHVGNVRDYDLRVSLLRQRADDLFVVFGKLFESQTMTDVVDTNPNRHQIRIQRNATVQLGPQQIRRRRTAHANVRQLRL